MIKILLVDDHPMVRLGVKTFLSTQPDLEIIGEAENGIEAVEKAKTLDPDIILMDLIMPIMDGVEATKLILEHDPNKQIIIVTSFLEDEKIYPAIKNGASGYILKTTPPLEIAEVIRKTYNGTRVITQEVMDKFISYEQKINTHELHQDLTDREMEILLLIAQGKSNQDIADILFITIKTVKSHISNIFSKLEVDDRTQATIYAFQKGLIK